MALVPWTRATSGMYRSRRVARWAVPGTSPECGPEPVTTVPVTTTTEAATTSTRLIQTTDGATIGTGRRANPVSGCAARRHSTSALASSSIDTRKWLITHGGESSFSTTNAPSAICTTTPMTRPSDRTTRSSRRGRRTSEPSTATTTAIDTSPVTRRFTNSTMA